MAALSAVLQRRGAAGGALTRNHLARYATAVFGALALVLFYQPWVTGVVPGLGTQRLTGLELARGETAARADQALFGASAAGAATGAGVSGTTGGLALPTRQPTAPAGGAGGASLPGGAFGSSSAPGAGGSGPPGGAFGASSPPGTGGAAAAGGAAAGGASAAGAGAALGGLALPTRIPTVTPLPSGQLSGGTGGQLAGGGAANVVLEIGRQVAREKEPDRLPQFQLFLVPLAALGLIAFPVVWERLYESRDRFFGKVWTLLLAYGGVLGVGYVLFMVSSAVAANDLLAPGEVKAAEWPLWGAFFAFLAAAVSITVAWLSPAPPPPERYARPAA